MRPLLWCMRQAMRRAGRTLQQSALLLELLVPNLLPSPTEKVKEDTSDHTLTVQMNHIRHPITKGAGLVTRNPATRPDGVRAGARTGRTIRIVTTVGPGARIGASLGASLGAKDPGAVGTLKIKSCELSQAETLFILSTYLVTFLSAIANHLLLA